MIIYVYSYNNVDSNCNRWWENVHALAYKLRESSMLWKTIVAWKFNMDCGCEFVGWKVII